MVDQFIENDSLDRKWTRQELYDQRGLSIVVSKDVSLFHRYSALWERHTSHMMNPVVNPLYRISGHAGKSILKKEAPDSTGKLSTGGDAYLPNTALLDMPSLDQNALLELKIWAPAAFADLARKFVLIDVPDRFR